MSERLDQLGEFGIFAELGPDEVAKVAEIARVERFPAGATLTEEGAAADRLYLFLSGKATVSVHTTLAEPGGAGDDCRATTAGPRGTGHGERPAACRKAVGAAGAAWSDW